MGGGVTWCTGARLPCAQVRLRAPGAVEGACGCLFDVKTGGNAARIALGMRVWGVMKMEERGDIHGLRRV